MLRGQVVQGQVDCTVTWGVCPYSVVRTAQRARPGGCSALHSPPVATPCPHPCVSTAHNKGRLLLGGPEWGTSSTVSSVPPRVGSFPVTAATNVHRLSGFKQHVFILLQFWRSEF